MGETQNQAAEATSAAEQQATAKPVQIIPNFDNKVDVKEFKFHFKKDELGNKRETLELKLPVPSVEGLVAILETGGKQLEALLVAATDIVAAQARAILNENPSMTVATFPTEQCLWEFIANMPDAEKRGRGIAKEVWDDFAVDYIAVMPALTGKSEEQVSLAAKLFLNKFQSVKTNKPVLKKLQEQLTIYITGSPNAENYTDCVKFLSEKADALLVADEAAMLANL
jgi:hypothetical protein